MIVLDTHVLIWWISSPDKLTKKAQKLIDDNKKINGILISSISVWEIYMLVKKDRLRLTMDIDTWIEKIEELPCLNFTPIDNSIASKSVTLPEGLHNDPADRMIIATAVSNGAVLVTGDEKILRYPHVQSVW